MHSVQILALDRFGEIFRILSKIIAFEIPKA